MRFSSSFSPQIWLQVLAAARGVGMALSPPRCGGCDWYDTHLFCPRCAAHLKAVPFPQCACCGEPFDPQAQVLAVGIAAVCADCRANRYHDAPVLKRARSVWLYTGSARRAVHRFKYENRWSLAAAMGAQMADFVRHSEDFPNLALVVPVPLFGWRQWRRGYNQSRLLAQTVARELQIPHADLLRRIRHTPSQTHLKGVQRHDNVRDAFAISSRYDVAQLAQNGAILLIDDVYTTGATLRECARQIKMAANDTSVIVYALTWARQPSPRFKHQHENFVTAPI